jgi:hypothetical protein
MSYSDDDDGDDIHSIVMAVGEFTFYLHLL